MKQKVHHFLVTLLGALWFGIILVGSMALFMFICRCFFRLVGVV